MDKLLLFFLIACSNYIEAATFGKLASPGSIWMGKTITIAGEDFYFNDKEEYELFQRKYASKYRSRNCLTSKTTQSTCECQQILFNARLRAIDKAVLMKDVRTRRSSAKYIKRFEKFRSKLEKFSKITKRFSKVKIKGEQCKQYGSYRSNQCNSKRRTNYRNKSCACYQKWINANVDYLSTKIKLELKKIRSLKLGSSNPLSFIKTTIGLFDKCQKKIVSHHEIIEDCSSKITPTTPVIESSPSSKSKAIAKASKPSSPKQICKPSKLQLPSTLKGLSKLDSSDLGTLRAIKRANQVLNDQNLANYLCKTIPIKQQGRKPLHSDYVPRVYSDIYKLSDRLPKAQKEIVRKLADHPCFKLGARKLKYCQEFNLSCKALRGGSTKFLQQKLIKYAKRSCLQSLCEGYFMDIGYKDASKINNLFSDILKGTSFKSMEKYCKTVLNRYPSEDGYPLTRTSCDGYNGPSRGVLKGEKCSPGNKPEYATFTRYKNGKIINVPKKPKVCKEKFAPSCFPNFDHDFFYCNLTPHVQFTKRCQRSKDKLHPKLKWNNQFSKRRSNLANIAKYSKQLSDLEINKLSYVTKDKLSEYYLRESVNDCIDGTFSEHAAKIYTGMVTLAGGAVVAGGAALISIEDNVRDYIKNVRDEMKSRYEPSTFDLSFAVEDFHSCMTKSCDVESQSKCFEILRDHDRKQFLYKRYYSLKCAATRIGKRMTNVASIIASSKVSASKLSKLAKMGKVAEVLRPEEVHRLLANAGCSDDKLNRAFNKISQDPSAYSKMARDEQLKAHKIVCEQYSPDYSQPQGERLNAATRLLQSFCNT